jgi:hypothetical protein
MAAYPTLLELYAAGLYLALSPQGGNSMPFPPIPRWAQTRPLPVQVAPGHWPLLRAEPRLAERTTAFTIRAVTTIESLEHFRSCITATWTWHPLRPPSDGSLASVPMKDTLLGALKLREQAGGRILLILMMRWTAALKDFCGTEEYALPSKSRPRAGGDRARFWD